MRLVAVKTEEQQARGILPGPVRELSAFEYRPQNDSAGATLLEYSRRRLSAPGAQNFGSARSPSVAQAAGRDAIEASDITAATDEGAAAEEGAAAQGTG